MAIGCTRKAVATAACAIAALTAVQACGGSPPQTSTAARASGADGRTIVGYFAQWGGYAGNYRVKDLQEQGAAQQLTHLVYAFGSTANGRCGIGDARADHQRVVSAADSVDGVADTPDQALRGNFNQLRKLKKQHPDLKILWSFGGWDGSAGLSQAARDPAAFAASCQQLVEDPRWADVFDGIDIDWEYPNACGKTCDRSGPAAFGTLISAIRTRFGPDNLVTAAITGDGNDRGKLDATDYPAGAAQLDWLMVMTYDYALATDADGPTAPHSPLRAYPGGAAGSSAEAAIRKLVGKGIPARKLLLGIGFYGRGWSGVSQPAPGGTATGPATGSRQPGIDDYSVLKDRCPPTGTVGDTAYAFCAGQWWSYDTPTTIAAKLAYAKEQGLGGAFAWELSGDTDDGELLAAIRTGLG